MKKSSSQVWIEHVMQFFPPAFKVSNRPCPLPRSSTVTFYRLSQIDERPITLTCRCPTIALADCLYLFWMNLGLDIRKCMGRISTATTGSPTVLLLIDSLLTASQPSKDDSGSKCSAIVFRILKRRKLTKDKQLFCYL